MNRARELLKKVAAFSIVSVMFVSLAGEAAAMTMAHLLPNDNNNGAVNKVKIVLDANGGRFYKSYTKVRFYKFDPGCCFGKLPVPTKPQHYFVGWFSKKKGGFKIKGSTPLYTHRNYYARFQMYNKYKIFKYTNNYRKSKNIRNMAWNNRLSRAAQLRAVEIARKFSHIRPNGRTCFSVAEGVHGENIAYGMGAYNNPRYIMGMWSRSKGHRKNMLRRSYKSMAVGYYKAKNGNTYWVQLFSYYRR